MLFGMRRIHKARRQSRLTITFTKNAGLIPKHHGHVLISQILCSGGKDLNGTMSRIIPINRILSVGLRRDLGSLMVNPNYVRSPVVIQRWHMTDYSELTLISQSLRCVNKCVPLTSGDWL